MYIYTYHWNLLTLWTRKNLLNILVRLSPNLPKFRKKVYTVYMFLKSTQEGDRIPPCMKNWRGAGNLTLGAALYAGDHISRRQDFSSLLVKDVEEMIKTSKYIVLQTRTESVP